MSKAEKAKRGRHYIRWIRAYIECLKFDRPVSMLNMIVGGEAQAKVNRSLQMELDY
jgi:hypothetical protein